MMRPINPALTMRKTTIILTLFIWTVTAHARAGIFETPSRLQQHDGTGKQPLVTALEQGKPVERELAADESHAYQLALASHQYALVRVDQRGIDIAVAVFDPDGKKMVEINNSRLGDWEGIFLVSEAPISYRLELRSPDKTASKGRYEIKITELRAATGHDKNRVAASQASAEAMVLYNQQTSESRRKAIEKYQQAADLWQSGKDLAGAANALNMIGLLYRDLGDTQKALEALNQGLSLARDSGDRRIEANSIDSLGSVRNAMGENSKAFDLLEQALAIRRAENDRVGEANTLNNLGMAYGSTAQPRKAVEQFESARSILNELKDYRKEATVLGNICVIYGHLGEYRKALDFCNRSLQIMRDQKIRSGEATALDNLGTTYSHLGEYQNALDAHIQSLAIHKEMGNRMGEAITLNNIGWIYATFGEYEKAIDYYSRALELLRDMGNKPYQATALNNIAANHADLKDYRKAIDIHMQLLALHREAGNKEGEALSLNNIAFSYKHLGEKQKALDYYSQAVALHRIAGNPRQLATGLRNLGALYRELGDHEKARNLLNEGLELSRSIGDRNSEAGILAQTAFLERAKDNLPAARSRIEEALVAIESLRINIKSQQLRASYFASVRNYHEFYVDLLMRLHKQHPSEGFDAAALQASEKGRARSLLELLAESSAEIRRDVDPALVERERSLRMMISDKAERQIRALSSNRAKDQTAASAKEIDALVTEYEQLQARIRQVSPRYASLTQPSPLTLKQIQSEVLDDETLLLEYMIGEEKSFMWAVTPTSISAFELPKRAEIEQAARPVYEILTARNKIVANETLEQRRKRLGQADAEYQKTSAALSRMLLGPVAAEMKNKRLLIVSEGLLLYIPFAALQNPIATDPHPLILDHEIVSLPSASVLSALRSETNGRKAADKTIAVFADPVFDSSDSRISPIIKPRSTAVETATGSISEIKRSAMESGLQDFARLRFSRQEADQIERLVAEGKKLKALDFAASRATVANSDLGRYAVLHFATHSLINNQHPDLSGIVLSLVDEQGRPQNGFLRLYDIYNLKLEADLVVLSACQTALGKEVKGEGLVGLTRGFMYAGAPRVVTSLWQIDDRATAEFMSRFYSEMLGKKLRPAAALRAAQVLMQKDKRWGAPYYWAAFTLQGEWR